MFGQNGFGVEGNNFGQVSNLCVTALKGFPTFIHWKICGQPVPREGNFVVNSRRNGLKCGEVNIKRFLFPSKPSKYHDEYPVWVLYHGL